MNNEKQLNEGAKEAACRILDEVVVDLPQVELNGDITDFLIEYEGIDRYESMDKRFVLTPSKKRECWVCTDVREGIVVVFREHHFEDDREVTILFNTTDEEKTKDSLERMQEWLEWNHYAKAMH